MKAILRVIDLVIMYLGILILCVLYVHFRIVEAKRLDDNEHGKAKKKKLHS